MVTHIVGSMEDGKKLHRIVRQLLPGVPLSGVYKMLRVGRVRLNGRKAKGDTVARHGDRIELRMGEEDFQVVRKSAKKFQGVPRQLEIVFEDNELIAVSKPAGLLTHGDAEEQRDTLVNRVLAYLYDNDKLEQTVFTPAPANRLDRNTSGLILFGKTGDAARQLAEGFKSHRIRKWYVALVSGQVLESGEINVRLTRDTRRNITRIDMERGKAARTRYRPVQSEGNTSVIRIELVSGRTHQIRVHMQHVGHPLLRDVKYDIQPKLRRPTSGQRSQPDSSGERYWLHAGWLLLPDGRSFVAPLPPPFTHTLQGLGYTDQQVQAISDFVPQDDISN